MTKPDATSRDMDNIVIVESPYAGAIERNMVYARRAMHDCFQKGETPFASHLIYTQPGILDDGNPVERRTGIEAGYKFWTLCKHIAFYADYGWSSGMVAAKHRAEQLGYLFEERRIGENR